MAAPEIPRRVVRGMAVLTAVAVALFVMMVAMYEPNGGMWFFGCVMLLSAVAFWAAYFAQRRRGR
ncbi:hypothetical protein ACFS2C_17390 [Prauserella oleivorans]|uniref:DUF2530 domain-containing protein n=1 Tax=Prauserella oleivorans TaxID=1478153 RepID=A0ABW5WDK4_9PSEU